jgi:large subunit ribosomal protein L14e
MDRQIGIGTVVLSKCGRDKGRYFIVCGLQGDDYVLLADGVLRKLARPKKKKIKHIAVTNDRLENIAQKLTDGKKVFDSELRGALRAYNDKKE